MAISMWAKNGFFPLLSKYTIDKELTFLREQLVSSDSPVRMKAMSYHQKRGNGTSAKRKIGKEMQLEKLF